MSQAGGGQVLGPQLESVASFAGLVVLATVLAAVSIAVRVSRARAQVAQLDALGIDAAAGRALEHGGRRLTAQCAGHEAHGSRHLLLSTPVAELPRLVIVRLRWLDRLARRCRLAVVAATGAEDFDRRYLVDCSYRELAGVLLREAAVRAAVQELFDAGARELQLARGQLRARFDLAALPAGDDAEPTLRHWSAALARVAAALPPFTGALTPIAPTWRGRRLALLCACVLAPVVALALCAIWHDAYMPLDLQALARDALASLPLVLPAVLLPGLLLLRGHPTSGRLLPALLAATAVATPPALVAATLFRNGYGEPQAQRVVLVGVTGRERLADAVPPLHRWSSTQLQRRGLLGALYPITAEVAEPVWRDEPLERAHIEVHIAAGRLGHPWIAAARALIEESAARPVSAADSRGEAVETPAPTAPALGLALAPLLSVAPQSGAALLAQARTLAQGEALAEALQVLDRAILALQAEHAPAPLRAQAHGYRAELYGRLGGSFEAQREADARAALALAPTQLEAALLLDDVLVRRARHEEALQLWTLLLQGRPDDRRGRFHLARTLATLGRIDEARRAAIAACRAGEAPACELLDSL